MIPDPLDVRPKRLDQFVGQIPHLPLARGAVKLHQMQSESSTAGGPEPEQPQSGSVVLLAEDNSDDAELLRLAFAKADVVVNLTHVPDGMRALQYLVGDGPYADRARHPFPSLLLVDLEMPHMGGLELLSRVRELPQWKSLPIVVVTASTYSKDIRRAYELGADSFLTKPPDLRDLVAAVFQLAQTWLPKNVSTLRPSASGASLPPSREPPPASSGLAAA